MKQVHWLLIVACLWNFLSCFNVSPQNNNTMTTEIIGKAWNAKEGAVVEESRSGSFYFIENLAEWDEVYIGKEVRVTGSVHEVPVVSNPGPDSVGAYRQSGAGVYQVVKEATWELYKQ